MTFDVLVEVQLLPGISDPQGATIERALPALGFNGVHSLRVGKAFRFRVEADDRPHAERLARDVADKLLANPVMESSHVRVTGAAGDGTATDGTATDGTATDGTATDGAEVGSTV